MPRVPFASCIERWGETEEMDDYFSAALGRRTRGLKHSRLATFPPFLMVQLKRCAEVQLLSPDSKKCQNALVHPSTFCMKYLYIATCWILAGKHSATADTLAESC